MQNIQVLLTHLCPLDFNGFLFAAVFAVWLSGPSTESVLDDATPGSGIPPTFQAIMLTALLGSSGFSATLVLNDPCTIQVRMEVQETLYSGL